MTQIRVHYELSYKLLHLCHSSSSMEHPEHSDLARLWNHQSLTGSSILHKARFISPHVQCTRDVLITINGADLIIEFWQWHRRRSSRRCQTYNHNLWVDKRTLQSRPVKRLLARMTNWSYGSKVLPSLHWSFLILYCGLAENYKCVCLTYVISRWEKERRKNIHNNWAISQG